MNVRSHTIDSKYDMKSEASIPKHPFISLGIIARNEEEIIGQMLASLFKQSLFQFCSQHKIQLEVIVVVNDSKDGTMKKVRDVLEHQQSWHSYQKYFSTRAIHLKEAGKINA